MGTADRLYEALGALLLVTFGIWEGRDLIVPWILALLALLPTLGLSLLWFQVRRWNDQRTRTTFQGARFRSAIGFGAPSASVRAARFLAGHLTLEEPCSCSRYSRMWIRSQPPVKRSAHCWMWTARIFQPDSKLITSAAAVHGTILRWPIGGQPRGGGHPGSSWPGDPAP